MDKLKQIFEKVFKKSEQAFFDVIHADSILLSQALFGRIIEGEEDPVRRIEILKSIQALDFDTEPENFQKSLNKAIKGTHGASLSKRKISSLKEMKVFKVKDIDAGFALCNREGKPNFSEIVAVHNASNISNIGQALMIAAVFLCGKYLECAGEFLSKTLYKTAGFETYRETPNVSLSNGTIETIYYMKLKGITEPS